MKIFKYVTGEGKAIEVKSEMNNKQWSIITNWLDEQEDQSEENIKNELKYIVAVNIEIV